METLEYIEEYFTGGMDPEEKKRFEASVRTDPAFASEVAYYLSVSRAATELNEEERLERFRTLESGRMAAPARVLPMRRYWMVAAASVAIAISMLVLFTGTPVSTEARRYADVKFKTLGTTMGGTADLTQEGIDAYNHEDYATARERFSKVLASEPENSQVLQLAGLTALQLDDYAAALNHFQKLAAIPELYSNSGPFLQAVTLLARNEGTDKTEAKKLLESVVRLNLYGKADAERWLKKMD